jgi:hypothetical protein
MPGNMLPVATLKRPEAVTQVAPQPQQQVPIEEMLRSISEYGTYGSMLRRATTMQEVGTKLAHIAEMAEQAVVSEAEDWYDQATLKRHTGEIKKYVGDFAKLAKDADMINQRMLALYEDMGRILERYFELPDGEDSAQKTTSDDTVSITGVNRETVPQLQESSVEEDKVISNPSEPPLATPDEEETSGRRRRHDEITLRAIQAVHSRLKQKNPELATKFAKLPPKMMVKVVWNLVGDTV